MDNPRDVVPLLSLAAALSRIKVQTGSLVCLGCRHEHNCSIHGCAIISKAIAVLETCAGLLPGRKGVPDCQDPNNAAK